MNTNGKTQTPEEIWDYIWGTNKPTCNDCGQTENLTHIVSPYVGSNPDFYLCPECLAKREKAQRNA